MFATRSPHGWQSDRGNDREVPLERIEAELTELAGQLAAGECRWLLLVGEYDRRDGYKQWGCRSCVQWLSWQCGLDTRAAREKLRVARVFEVLPVITREFGAGKLSYSKVRALTRIATPENEADLVELAEHATAAQVERVVRAYRRTQKADDAPDGVCEIDGGTRLAPETARRLMCDASVVWMLQDGDGRPVNVSTRTRSIPPSLRRAVHARDQGCDFPGCGERSFTDIHHIRHRAQGGDNSMVNLAELCWHHHRLVHEGGWGLRRGRPGHLIAIRPDGTELDTHDGPGFDHRGIGLRNGARGVIVTSATAIPQWYGGPLDVNWVIDSLWCTDDRAS